MEKKDRKAALAAYRERKVEPGIYAVRCGASGEVWVGRAQDLPAVRNRIFFTLRQGSSPHRTLQAAWNTHGADGLAFEVLEVLDPEELELAFERALKDRHAHWLERLGATRL
jgi:hypothetical protein